MNTTLLTFLAAYALMEAVSRARMTRFLLAQLFRFFIWLDLAAQWIVRLILPPRFVVMGECHRRGVCCQQIIFAPPKFIREQKWIFKLALGYHRLAHNFHPVGEGPNQETIFACGHLSPNGRCSIYRYRPLLCRNYPVVPYFEPPAILPGCGFFAVPRVVVKMRTHPRLRIVNPYVAIHHPTPETSDESLKEHYVWVEETPLD